MDQHKHTAINIPLRRMEKIDFAQITVAYRGMLSYFMYRAIERATKLADDNNLDQSLWIIQNSLKSRIVIDTCKFIHESSRIFRDTIRNNEKLCAKIEKMYKNFDDYTRTLTAYRDKEICHCDFKYLFSDKYDFCLMSELLNDDIQKAEDDTIYLDEQGRYCVRDPEGFVRVGNLPENLNVSAETLAEKLKEEKFKDAVLDYTSGIDRKHTCIRIKSTYIDISYEIFKIVFDEIFDKHRTYNNTAIDRERIFLAYCSNSGCLQEYIELEVRTWFPKIERQ